jgi:hypothetical protein
MHGESPLTVPTPGSILEAALVDAQGSPMQMPPVLHAKQGSYSSASSSVRVRQIVVTKDQSGHTKSTASQSAVPTTATASSPATIVSIPQAKPEAGSLKSPAKEAHAAPWKTEATSQEKDTTQTKDQHAPQPVENASSGTKEPTESTTTKPSQPDDTSKSTTQAPAKSKLNLDKPMPDLPRTHGKFDDHIREVREAERSEKEKKRKQGKPSLPDFPSFPGPPNAPFAQYPPRSQSPVNRRPDPRSRAMSPTPHMARNGPGPYPGPRPGPRPLGPGPGPRSDPHFRSQTPDKMQRPQSPFAPANNTMRPNMTNKQVSSRNLKENEANAAAPSAASSATPRPQSPTLPNESTTSLNSTLSKPAAPSSGSDQTPKAEPTTLSKSDRPASPPKDASTTNLTVGNVEKHDDPPPPPLKDRDIRSPTPDLTGRPRSPAESIPRGEGVVDHVVPARSKASEQARAATPDLSSAAGRTPAQNAADVDPVKTLQGIHAQIEGLHSRYVQLRGDRIKLSTAISAALREQKPGPDYANMLLDQHLSLNAINSSMDICFAKLKALDCRKEDAIAALIERTKRKSDPAEMREPLSARLAATASPMPESGRSTPDVEPKTLAPSLFKPAKSPSLLGLGLGFPTPEIGSNESPVIPQGKDGKRSADPEKRVTAIRNSGDQSDSTRQNKSGLQTKESPVLPSSTEEQVAKNEPSKAPVDEGKAAQFVDLIPQTGDRTSGSRSAAPTLETSIPNSDLGLKGQLPKASAGTKPMSPKTPVTATAAAMPKRKPVPSPRQGTNDSVSSSTTGESAAEEHEARTPRLSSDEPFGLKSAKRGMLQTIQVFVDDDILDYYHNGSDRR